jgi:hypothetical protein
MDTRPGPIRLLRYLWAAPATLLGLACLPLAWLGGGRCSVVEGVLEIHGGLVGRLLRGPLPCIRSAAAMTLGHVVIAQDPLCLDLTREHEHVHVRQYERWGPLFIPAYLLWSLVLFLRGAHPYLDNPFEREADSAPRGEPQAE